MLILESQPLNGRSGHEAGRCLLQQMYRSLTGQPLPQISILPQGKPCFSSGTLHFSISHTSRHVFCALSDSPVGIDAEELDRNISLRLAEKILSPTEYERFVHCSDPRETLLRFWVLKEAQVKYTGTGLCGYPNHTDFSPDDPRIRIRDGCLVAIIQQEANHAL